MPSATALRLAGHGRVTGPDQAITESRQGGKEQYLSARGAFFGMALLLVAALPALAAEPGTVLRNRAQLDYVAAGQTRSQLSNEVTATVQTAATPSAVSILRYSSTGTIAGSVGPTQCRRSTSYAQLATPTLLDGTVINPANATPLTVSDVVHADEPVFVRVADADQNRDSTLRDSIDLQLRSAAGDFEVLRLLETGTDSGEFLGYIATTTGNATPGDCQLQVVRNETLSASYADPLSSADRSNATALVDPYGLVFDSSSGAAIDGARVRLVEATSGQDAVVYGDDGVSRYPSQMITGGAVTDAAGTTYTLPAGVFRFPLVAPGSYRLVITPPAGYAAPSQVTEAALQTLDGAPFRLGAGSYGNAFSASAPPAVALDVPLDPAGTQLYLQKSTASTTAAVGDFVQYTLTAQNAAGAGAFSQVTITDDLPPGLRFRAGSVRINGTVGVDPALSADGRQLQFTTGALAAGAGISISYVAEVTAAAQGTRLINRAHARAAEGVASNEVQATILLREELFRETGMVVGRVIQATCDAAADTAGGVAGIRIYMEDGRYALTDAEGKYHFEGVTAGTHVVQLDNGTVPPELAPARCAEDVRHAGRSFSQFIELQAGNLTRADFRLTAQQPVGETGLPKRAIAPEPISTTPPSAEASIDIEQLTSASAWVLPAADALPVIPSIKVAISHHPAQRVELAVNGEPVSPLNFDGVSKNLAGSVGLSRWRGIDLIEGENRLTAVVRNADGSVASELSRVLHYGDGAVRAVLLREQSVLSADGTTRPVIALRMVDRYGKPARAGTVGAFSVDAPYRSWWEVRSLHENQLLATSPRQPTFEVDRDGIARIELEATAQAGTAVLHLQFSERHQQELPVWLEPQARDWILVGVASGTATYQRISQNLQAASDAGIEEGYADQGRVAFFAKGAIKGSYLLTAAFDSARDTTETEQRLLGTIEPDRYYTIYGDASEQRFEAASTQKLYLKVERGRFYGLFGDFDTGLTVTDLARYSRTFTGLKSEYAGERMSYTAFATDTSQGYLHDEFAGDGTSGLYHLSWRDLIINSDKLRLETRDRLHPGQLIESRTLTRHLDYSIDYLNGTVFFRQPVPVRDENFNSVFVIAEYEVQGAHGEVTAGGRAALKLMDGALELGSTLINQGSDAGDTRLGGLDLRWENAGSTRVRAEVARTDSEDASRPASAAGWKAEAQHVTRTVDARLYAREQQTGFGLGQQSALDTGTRRFGADGRWKFADHWQARTEAYWDQILGTGGERRLGSAELRREDARRQLGIGLRHVTDESAGGNREISQQALISGSLDLWQSKVRLRAAQDVALGGRSASSDYPDRTLLGVDYRWNLDTTLFTEYEHSEGAAFSSDMTRLGVRTVPWRRAQVQSSLTQQFTEYGPRLFNTLGLTQGWQASERWTFDFGVDQTRTLTSTVLQPLNPAVPLASGSLQEDYLAAFVGALYRNPLWTFTTRIEHRDADSEQRWVMNGGFYREPLRGHAFSLAASLIDSDVNSGLASSSRAQSLRLSWAYRPASSRWIVLDRLDLKFEDSGSGVSAIHAARVVNNLNANWQLDRHSQLGLQFAARYSGTSFAGDRYSGFATLTGFDFRHDLSAHFDFGLHGTSLQSWSSRVADYALGADIGVTVTTNVWISLGYNFRGFADRDFAANRYTAQGLMLNFRIKADQDTFKDLSLASLRPR